MSATTNIRGQRVSVIGAARSGFAAAALLKRQGASVLLSEHGTATEAQLEAVKKLDVPSEFGGHTAAALDVDFVVVSPGVPDTAPVIAEAMQTGIPVWSEVEVASWFCQAPIIAVTGTNGKTTVTSWLGDLFGRTNHRTIVAGNIGEPFSQYADDTDSDDRVILEVSSYQLDHIGTFAPDVALILNITPDHLYRYADFDAYADSKLGIARNMTADGVLVFNHEDEYLRKRVNNELTGPHRTIGFDTTDILEEGGFVRQNEIILRHTNQEESVMTVEQVALRGRHNLSNALAVAVASRVSEIRSDIIRESLMSFEGVPHRLETVREVEGVTYVNDSKATNVNSVWYALESVSGPIVLIAGGRDKKGSDYKLLGDLARSRVKLILAIGEAADRIIDELGDDVESIKCASLEAATHRAKELSEQGDTVLLSPGCSSFDQFENFEQRGDDFKRLVWQL